MNIKIEMGKIHPFTHLPQGNKETGPGSRKAHKKLSQADRRRSCGEYHIGIETGGHLFVHQSQKYHASAKGKQHRHAPGLSGKPESQCQVKASVKQAVSHSHKFRRVPPDKFLDFHGRPLRKIPVVTDAAEHK